MRELVCFRLPEAVPCICDKNNWHHKLSLRVNQLLEGLLRSRDWHPPAHQHAINIEQQPEARLWLQRGAGSKHVRQTGSTKSTEKSAAQCEYRGVCFVSTTKAGIRI